MPRSPEERATPYRNYAFFLRLLAGRTRAHTVRAHLRQLANKFDQLAASVQSAKLAA